MADSIEDLKKKNAYYERLINEVKISKKYCLPCLMTKFVSHEKNA